MKLKTIYACSECGFQNSKWTGQCPDCQNWNTLIEDVINVGKEDKGISLTPRKFGQKPVALEVDADSKEKFSSLIREFDRVVGEGITERSLILMSGEPGIGKSTLTLQIAGNISKSKKVLIVSGEESIDQIARRAARLKIDSKAILALNENNLENIIDNIQKEKPEFVIIDSIQVMSSQEIPGSCGSISQVRHCTERLLEIAKNQGVTILLIGHVTKEGNLAGPRVLEHLVDTVLLFEGDRHHNLRILRAVKNRFGSCSEVGIFQMEESGLSEVRNISKQFLYENQSASIGSCITVTMEGNRPMLIEVQALVATTHFGYPKRTANGFDLNRLQILIAALEKYAKVNLQNQDVFINVVGGMKLKDPAADLAIVMAIISSLQQKPLGMGSVAFGEIGLSGDIHQVVKQDHRIKEAKSLGFDKVISPKSLKSLKDILSSLAP